VTAGQLTNNGSQQLLALGRNLRALYVDKLGVLPTEMSPNFNISHTYITRTQQSAENLFAGLYPPSTRPTNTTLTMHVRPSPIEVLISNPTACPKLANLTAQYAASSAYASTLAQYNNLQTTLVNAYNTSRIKGYNTTAGLFDTAAATYCAGLGLKGNLTASDIQTLVVPGTSAYHNVWRPNNPNHEEAKMLGVGPWLQEIVSSLTNYSSPLEVYSAHDASLDMFLAVVADPDLPWPPYASNVLTEVWRYEGNGSTVVRMFYEGMVVPAVEGLGCSLAACPLETFMAFLKSYVPQDLRSACTL
jgi:hypothetical protein